MRYPFEDMQDGANSVRERKEEPDALVKRKRAMLWKMLKTCTHERYSTYRPVEQVARRGRWIPRVPPRSEIERGKRKLLRQAA